MRQARRVLGLVAAGVLVVAGCSPKVPSAAGTAPQGGVPRVDLRVKSQSHLRNIGLAYLSALTSGQPPRGADELKQWLEGGDRLLKSPRDDQPYEIVWGVDPAKLQTASGETLLAWETTADPEGGRNVLMADCKTVAYLKEAEFQKATKAKGR